MDSLLQDVKHALRAFLRNPGFVLTAVVTLALGIAVNTAVFSVVNAVLLKPIPFPDPDRLVMFMSIFDQGTGPAASPAKFQHYREQTDVVEDVSAFRNGVVNYTGGDFAEQLRLGQVSADYFRLFQAPIILGRSFLAAEDLPRAGHVAMISEGLWKRHFGGDRGVIGKSISLSGEPYTIVGVVSSRFDTSEFGPRPELWIPFQLDPNTSDQGHYFMAAGRLKPGVMMSQAQAKIKLSVQEFLRKFPRALAPHTGFTVAPFQEAFVSNARPTLWVMMSAVGLVLLIACANVANLLLVRATGRRQEIAIRAAIGAGRGRIVRQLLTESLVLSLTGGVVGLALGLVGIRALLAINTAGLPRLGEKGTLVGADWRVLFFTLAISIGSGILFGLIPALQISRGDLTTSLKEGGGRTGTGFRHNKARSLLVITELALALILLVGSALLIRTTVALGGLDPGFDPNNVLTMRMSLTGPKFLKSGAVEQLVREGTEQLRALPGVEAASAACCIPLEGGYGLPFNIVGRPPSGNTPFLGGGNWANVSPGYFEVFKIPLKRGRVFNDSDDKAGRPVVVINEAMAKKYWNGGDPLGDQMIIGKGIMKEFAAEPPRQIVGIVGDSRDGALNQDPFPKMFIPQAQVPDAVNALGASIYPMAWVVRTRVEPYSLSRAIQDQLRQVSGLPTSDVRTMKEVVSISLSRQRFNMILMVIFGSSAFLMAVVGIYGLMANSVQQRTQEIGIRIAIGAHAGAVRNMILLQGIQLVLIGLTVGMGSAFGLTRFLASLLFGVKAVDPVIFAAIPILLSAVSLAAIWLPALRASQLDPMVALRHE